MRRFSFSGRAPTVQVLFAAALLVGCGGNEFSGCPDGDACENAGTGGKAGQGAGGKGGSGGSAGDAGTGGGDASGGAGASGSAGSTGSGGAGGGTAGAGTDAGPQFPRTPVLDDFNRIDGPIGTSWLGNTGSFEIDASKLAHADGSCEAVLWHAPFGVEQEVFATLSSIDTAQPEMNIVLKAQELSDCELVEVLYDPSTRHLSVHYCTAGQWSLVDGLPLTIAPGQVLGARALADAELRVYIDAVLVKIFDISAYPHHALGGRIGVNCQTNSVPDGHAWDDFGGG